jgi:hypothetical protein
MRQSVLCDNPGRIVAFVLEYPNAAGVRTMDGAASDMPTGLLLDQGARRLSHPVLVERDRRVIEHGNSHSYAQFTC